LPPGILSCAVCRKIDLATFHEVLIILNDQQTFGFCGAGSRKSKSGVILGIGRQNPQHLQLGDGHGWSISHTSLTQATGIVNEEFSPAPKKQPRTSMGEAE
jgi:hypothetical protein